jgi:uncharacterized FlgJ-related protein
VSNPCNITEAVKFVFKYRGDSEILARQVDVPFESILGLAAHESLYGGGRIARENNNYFSMHAPAPFQIGVDTAKDDPRVKVA